MSYSKDVGEVSARYHPGGEVPSVTYPSGTHVVFTAPGSATSGQYGLFEWNMTGTRGGADPHFHKTFSESFYVMEGTVRLFNGETWIDAVKGDFLYVPQGGVHAFSNESGAPARAPQAATTPRKRHVPGELVHEVTLGRDRELVHQLVGHPDRRAGGRGHGQRVSDAGRYLPGLGGAPRGELDPRGRPREVASMSRPGGQRGV